jgi:hypothetical protein
MSGLGKKILGAFVEVNENEKSQRTENAAGSVGSAAGSVTGTAGSVAAGRPDDRFAAHFDQLFSEANIPGPDYYEFSRMTAAMQAIADEQARFYAAFAGLQVQGLDKDKLLSTAAEYLKVLEADASRFQSTVDNTLQEKVTSKKSAVEEKDRRIQALSQEINDLQQQITTLKAEIRENEEKIEASTGGYAAESQRRKAAIQADMEKIKHYIH